MTRVPDTPFPPPYPGLRSFNTDEQLIFFGRDAQVYFMTDRLEAERFLCITGPSGCGKSSLARTGLISGLQTGQIASGEEWVILDTHPGNDPMNALVRVIADNLAEVFADPETSDQLPHDFDLPQLIARNLELVHYDLSRVLSGFALFKGRPVLLLVDQFEELFEYAKKDPEGAARFARLLLDALRPTDGVDLYLVVTVRADALDNCSRYEGLAEAINRGQFLTPALSREELSEIIRGPVALHNGDVAPAFVGWLLNQMAHEPDRLPLLQHAMNILWDDEAKRIARGENETQQAHLDINDFKRNFAGAFDRAQQMGDALRFAMSDRLDEVFEALDSRLKPLAERVFCSLVEVFAGDKDIKRPLTIKQLSEVCAASEDDIRIIVDHFRKPGRQYLHPVRPNGLDAATEANPDVYVTSDLTSNTVVRVMHECLLRQWRKLRFEWLRDHERAITDLQFLAQAAMAHACLGGASLSETQVKTYAEWRERHTPTLRWGAPFLRTIEWWEDGELLTAEEVYKRSMDFLSKCERQVRDQKLKARLRRKRRGFMMYAACGVALIFAVGSFIFYDKASHSFFVDETKLLVEISNLQNVVEISNLQNGALLDECTDPGVGLRADDNQQERVCKPDLSQQEIQEITARIVSEGKNDQSYVESFVDTEVKAQQDEALSRFTAIGGTELEEATNNTFDSKILNAPLVKASLDQRNLGCDEMATLSELKIKEWSPAKSVKICTPVADEEALADFPSEPSDVLAVFNEGRRQLNRGYHLASIETFERVYTEEPNVPRLYRHAGWAYLGQQEPASAWTCFRQALNLACKIKENDQAQDEQLLWSWSNLTAVPESHGNVAIAAAAWAQKAILYDIGGAYSPQDLNDRPHHAFRRFEANLGASAGFFVLGGCDSRNPVNTDVCDVAFKYLSKANKFLQSFVERFGKTTPTNTRISQLSTAAWEWITNERLRALDKEGKLAEDIVRALEDAVERSDAKGPYIPLSMISCKHKKDLESARAYQEKWPITSFKERKTRAEDCMNK